MTYLTRITPLTEGDERSELVASALSDRAIHARRKEIQRATDSGFPGQRARQAECALIGHRYFAPDAKMCYICRAKKE